MVLISGPISLLVKVGGWQLWPCEQLFLTVILKLVIVKSDILCLLLISSFNHNLVF